MPRTGRQVIVDEAGRLHERLARSSSRRTGSRARAGAFASASDCGRLRAGPRPATATRSARRAADEGPDPGVEASNRAAPRETRARCRRRWRSCRDGARCRGRPPAGRCAPRRSGRRGRDRSRRTPHGSRRACSRIVDHESPACAPSSSRNSKNTRSSCDRHAPFGVVVVAIGIAAFGPGTAGTGRSAADMVVGPRPTTGWRSV